MSFRIIAKSVCRRGALLGMLAALLIGILLCGRLGNAAEMPRCGLVSGSEDACAAALYDALVRDGMMPYADEAALRRALQSGEISMGAILPDDLTAHLAARDTQGVIRFLNTPTTVLAPLQKLRITARLTEVYAPYLTAALLADAGISMTAEEAQTLIRAYLSADTAFHFTYESVAGAPLTVEGLGLRGVRGCIALLLFCIFGFFACPFSGAALRRLSGRLCARDTLLHLILPGALTVLLLTGAVCSASLLLCDRLFGIGVTALIPAALCYAVFMSGIGLLFAALLNDASQLALTLSTLTLLSVVFCPFFFDLPALLGFAWIRFVLPPSFFMAAERGGVAWAVAAAVWLCALALLWLRFRVPRKN